MSVGVSRRSRAPFPGTIELHTIREGNRNRHILRPFEPCPVSDSSTSQGNAAGNQAAALAQRRKKT